MAGERMLAEMSEQPRVLAAIAARRAELVAAVRAVVPRDLSGILLIARGSSDNAAIFGRYAFELACGRPVALAAPSLHTVYGARSDYRGYLAIAVSQSGRTPEIVTLLEAAARAGAATIALTNDAASPLASAAGLAIDLGAGAEVAVPATKTFTAQVATLAVIAEALGEVPWGDADWAALPGAVSRVLDDTASADRVAASIGDARGLITVGRGFLFAIALEAALKLKETAFLLAEGYSAADLLHGPVAVVQHGFPVLAFAGEGPTKTSMVDLVTELRGRGGRVAVVGPADGDLPVPTDLAEALATIPAAVRAPQVARALTLLRGLDPDAPAGLTKITLTH
ncbi:MAG: SIS domain-containing protein [Actinomycetota bacterium]